MVSMDLLSCLVSGPDLDDQCKDKFLSSVSTGAFGFCSVILSVGSVIHGHMSTTYR